MKIILIYLIFALSILAQAQISPTSNTLKFGNGTGSDKQIVFNKGSGSGDPKIRWNNSTSKIQFSTDGTNYSDIPFNSSVFGMTNGAVACSVAANALTCSVKQTDGSTNASSTAPVFVGVRSSTLTSGAFNVRSITAALSQTIAASTKLDLTANTGTYMYIYYIDSDGSGTSKLGLSTKYWDDGNVYNILKESGTGTVTIATPGVWTWTSNNLADGDPLSFTTTGALPTGLTAGTTYYVVNNGTDGSGKFRVARVPGGQAIATTGSQSGVHTVRSAGNRIVSDDFYTLAAVKMIGYFKITQATPGTWATSPSRVYPSTNLSTKDDSNYDWFINAEITGLSFSPACTSTAGAVAEIADAGTTFTTQTGSLPAAILCSTTNPPTGSTCDAGSESLGVYYNQPSDGAIEICFQGQYQNSANTSNASALYTQWVETPAAAQTQTTLFIPRAQAGSASNTWTSNATQLFRNCSIAYAAAGFHAFRLMYGVTSTATCVHNIVCDSANNRTCAITVRPLTRKPGVGN